MPCKASGVNCYVVGDQKLEMREGQTVTFTIVAKDKSGVATRQGGDIVYAKLSQQLSQPGVLPHVRIEDYGNGRYGITCPPLNPGEYKVEVTVNGTKLADIVSVTSIGSPGWFHLDVTNCCNDVTISTDKHNVTHSSKYSNRAVVLGSKGVRQGRHGWRVKFNHTNPIPKITVGVTEKRAITTDGDFPFYGWHCCGNRFENGRTVQLRDLQLVRTNDVLRFDLDCDKHTLKVVNLRSGEEASIVCSLPNAELFPYFSTFHLHDSLSLIW